MDNRNFVHFVTIKLLHKVMMSISHVVYILFFSGNTAITDIHIGHLYLWSIISTGG